MAPLGEWSLEATVWLGPGACPAPSHSLTEPTDGIFRSPPTPRNRRRTISGSGGFGDQAAVAYRVAVALGEIAQLPKSKRAATAGFRDHDPGPQALRTW